jgi:hypothetical protein
VSGTPLPSGRYSEEQRHRLDWFRDCISDRHQKIACGREAVARNNALAKANKKVRRQCEQFNAEIEAKIAYYEAQVEQLRQMRADELELWDREHARGQQSPVPHDDGDDFDRQVQPPK